MNEQEKLNFIKNHYLQITKDFFDFLQENFHMYFHFKKLNEFKNIVEDVQGDNKLLADIIFKHIRSQIHRTSFGTRFVLDNLKINPKLSDDEKKILFNEYKISKFEVFVNVSISAEAIYPIFYANKVVFDGFFISETNFRINAKIDNIVMLHKPKLFLDLCLRKVVELSNALKKDIRYFDQIKQIFQKTEDTNIRYLEECYKNYFHIKEKFDSCITEKTLVKNIYFNFYSKEIGVYITRTDGTVVDKLVF